MNRHRSTHLRPRYGRLAAAGVSAVVTGVAVLGSTGLLPGIGDSSEATTRAAIGARPGTGTAAGAPPTPAAAVTAPTSAAPAGPATSTPSAETVAAPAKSPVPGDSGQGRRVVFSQGQQRVWLIGPQGNIQRTYLVSGSQLDNLEPGDYQVYSRSRWAVGVDDSGVMQHFVRFAQGPGGSAIGFHSIPTSHGTPLQGRAQLGTPQSHGCIRQAAADSVALWQFAPLGTEVAVVAS